MIRIRYFALIRERLHRGEEAVSPPAEVADVTGLLDWLGARDEAALHAFADRKSVRVAVDEMLVDHDASIVGARTVAIFPPMTGG